MTTTPPEMLLTRTDIARCYREATGGTRFDETHEIFAREVERALLARLSEQQPVEWQWRWREGGPQMREWRRAHQDCSNLLDCPVFEYRALYAAPVPTPAQAAQAVPADMLQALESCIDAAQQEIDTHVINLGENYRPARLKAMRDDVAKARAAVAMLAAAPTPTGAGDDQGGSHA